MRGGVKFSKRIETLTLAVGVEIERNCSQFAISNNHENAHDGDCPLAASLHNRFPKARARVVMDTPHLYTHM